MTAYFVDTALTAVRPVSPWTRRFDAAALTVAVALALGAAVSGFEGISNPGLSPGAVPVRTIAVMSFILATVLTLAAIGDMRVMRFGAARGRPRLARHLWRMCFALFIAAGSFFSIRERVATILPEPFTTGPNARAADRADLRRDVLLAVEAPRPPRGAGARPARSGACRRSLNQSVPFLTRG